MIFRRAVALFLSCSLVLGAGGSSVLAAYARSLSPASGSTVSGTVEISLGFISDAKAKATKVLVKVDGDEYGTKFLATAQERGVVSIMWDSTRFGDGLHGISLYVFSGSRQIGKAYIEVTVKNGSRSVAKPSAGPGNKGQVHLKFDNIRDGERVSGSKVIRLAPDSTAGPGAFVSLYVDKNLKFVSNRAPFEFRLDTAGLADGTHVVEAEVRGASQDVVARNSVRINVQNKGTLAGEIAKLSDEPSRTQVLSSAPAPAIAASPASKAPGAQTQRAARASEAPAPTAPVKAAVRAPKPVVVAKIPDSEKLPAKPVVAVAPTVQKEAEETAISAKAVEAPAVAESPAKEEVPDRAPVRVMVDAAAPEVSPAAPRPVRPEARWQGYEAKAVETPVTVRPSIQGLSTDVAASEVRVKPLDPEVVLPRVEPLTAPSSSPAKPEQATEKVAQKPEPHASPADIRKLTRPETHWSGTKARPVDARIMSRPQLAPSHYESREDPRATRKQPIAKMNPPKPVAMAMAAPPVRIHHDPGPMRTASEVAEMTFLRYDAPEPIVKSGRALVQLRQAVEKLGGRVSWNHRLKRATAVIGGRKLVANMRSLALKADGELLPSLRMRLVNGRIWLEARKLAQAFPVRVKWNSAERSIRIERRISEAPKAGQGSPRKPLS